MPEAIGRNPDHHSRAGTANDDKRTQILRDWYQRGENVVLVQMAVVVAWSKMALAIAGHRWPSGP